MISFKEFMYDDGILHELAGGGSGEGGGDPMKIAHARRYLAAASDTDVDEHLRRLKHVQPHNLTARDHAVRNAVKGAQRAINDHHPDWTLEQSTHEGTKHLEAFQHHIDKNYKKFGNNGHLANEAALHHANKKTGHHPELIKHLDAYNRAMFVD
jgi:hypothetical protein